MRGARRLIFGQADRLVEAATGAGTLPGRKRGRCSSAATACGEKCEGETEALKTIFRLFCCPVFFPLLSAAHFRFPAQNAERRRKNRGSVHPAQVLCDGSSHPCQGARRSPDQRRPG
ncbi:hypothetical protein TGRH88_070740 [Toxoplasma gondii]|uniref:Uncharacterized protein n=1 Tax=Toxoplasma gondii TaxID=5811 RepID=A0A7J6K2V5_TOXGO|nr:hypothetical protein TGRH88_070740 [Toxoplasma gondii]